jgi:predicted DNA-binding transcriptional regulator YafY
MEAARGVLTLLRLLAERPRSRGEISDLLREEGLERGERSVRRWLAVLRSSGFDLRNSKGLYELHGSPVRLSFGDYETLATLSVLGSLAAREPVYGTYLASAVRKLRAAIPEDSLRFADGGGIEFTFDPASDPPEDPAIMDTLRRATRQSRRAEISYHSLRSDTVRRRTVEPVRLAYAQRAHRLYAYEREENRVTEFRVNRIREAKMLPDKFSPEAHRHSLEDVRVHLEEGPLEDRLSLAPYDQALALLPNRYPETFYEYLAQISVPFPIVCPRWEIIQDGAVTIGPLRGHVQFFRSIFQRFRAGRRGTLP